MTEDGDRAGPVTFWQMASAFDAAALAHPEAVSTNYYRFAGRLARVRIVGRKLAAAIDRPFAHLRVGGTAAPPAVELAVDLWDESATGMPCPGTEPPRALNGMHRVYASTDTRFVVYDVVNTRAVIDRVQHRVVGWATASETLTVYERARPLAGPLLLWLTDRGVQGVHAGLVAREGRGVLLGGPSGSGKSTCALACLEAGFDYLADDHVALERAADGVFRGHGLFASGNLETRHLQSLALSSSALQGQLPGEEKSLLLLSEFLPGRLTSTAAITAIALPRVARTPTTAIRPASKRETLLRLGPSSLFLLPHARGLRAAFEELAGLVDAVPGYWLDLGSDLNQIAPAISELLRITTAAERLG